MDAKHDQGSAFTSLMPIILTAVAVPLSMFLWIGNMAFSFFTSAHDSGKETVEN
jgi:hypothetical protein